MRCLGLAVAAILMSATIGFAQSNKVRLSKEPFAVNADKLGTYLQLTPCQYNEVAAINTYFIEKQSESIAASGKNQARKMHQAVYGNLKLMKNALTPEQYRKYVVLLNVTNNNNRLAGINAFPEMIPTEYK